MGCGCCGSSPDNGKKIENMDDFRSRVADAIERIRPALQMDGGDVTLVDVTDTGDVHLSLVGACAFCPHATMTLKMGIERVLKEEIPEVNEVVQVESGTEVCGM
jgi:Fe-S cluster biogenesis protein NfuA